MAIADFFHCKNIPVCVVKSTWFNQLLENARYDDNDFKIPNKKKMEVRLYFLFNILVHLC